MVNLAKPLILKENMFLARVLQRVVQKIIEIS